MLACLLPYLCRGHGNLCSVCFSFLLSLSLNQWLRCHSQIYRIERVTQDTRLFISPLTLQSFKSVTLIIRIVFLMRQSFAAEESLKQHTKLAHSRLLRLQETQSEVTYVTAENHRSSHYYPTTSTIVPNT